MTVKLRSGLRPGDRSGVAVAVRLVEEAGVAAIAFHPRSAAVQHKGTPDYGLVRELTGRIDVPVIVSGGLDTAERARAAYRESGADAVMIARGSFGYPWIFEELTGSRTAGPDRDEVVAELLWVIDARRGAPRDRARRPLPAQVLPLVSGADRALAAARRPASSSSRSRRRPGRVRELRTASRRGLSAPIGRCTGHESGFRARSGPLL